VLFLLCLSSIGCGAGTADPDQRAADWEENFNRVNKARVDDLLTTLAAARKDIDPSADNIAR